MKEYRNIEELLERYYNAQTSEAEEQRLRDFFVQEEIPPHLQKEKEMFLQLQAVQVPEGLEERLSKQIDQWSMQERFTQKTFSRRALQWIGSIAASLLILFSIGWYFHAPQPRKDTCATPEEAYAHAEKALVMFSEALNKGIRPIQNMEKTNENIRKQINKLNNIEL